MSGHGATEDGALAFELTDRGFTVRCWYGVTPRHNAIAIITDPDGGVVGEFGVPAIKVWNVAAHFADTVDDLLAGRA